MTEKWMNILKEADSRLNKGDLDGAIRLCNEVINLQGNTIPREVCMVAFGMRGIAYQKKGEFERAISDYDEVIKIDPKHAAAFNNRGIAYKEKGDFERAISDYDEAINLYPENALAFNNRGSAYQAKGDFERAISNFDEAIKIDPKNAAAFNNRGNAYKEKGDFERAISDFDKSIKLKPKNAGAFNNRGTAYREKNDFERAIRDFDEAIKLNPKHADIFNNRGIAYAKKGEIDCAISDFGEAIKIDPKDAIAFNNRGNAYREKGDFERAISDCDEAIKLNPKQADAFNNRGIAYQEKDDFERAVSDFGEAIKLDPNHTKAFHNRALTYGRRDAQASEKKFREKDEMDPGKVIAIYKAREGEYNTRIVELTKKIDAFAEDLHNRLAEGFVGIALFIVATLIFGDDPLGLVHGFALTSLMLAWLAVNYPASMRLNDMRKEKREMESCVEDYFRKLTLARYTQASKGDERQKMVAATHAHFATRSAAEFSVDRNPVSDDKSNPLLDFIKKTIGRKDGD